MNYSIINFKQHQKCPIINGVLYCDGVIQDFDIIDESMPPLLKVGGKLKLEDIEELYWADCSILDTCSNDTLNVEALCGEGDEGAEGYVALVDQDSGSLIWIAFFTCSNPFCNIVIQDKEIIAKNNLDNIWRFPIESPESFFIES